MQNMFQQDLSQFITYEKPPKQKKSRTQKQKQKIQKLNNDMNDPQQRRQRHRLRRQQDKAKLQRQLQGMTEEQARIYLDKKKQEKILAKERNIRALQFGMPILIDAIYEDKMNDKENKSLAIQVELIMKAIKHMQDPPGIHLCSVGGSFQTQLQKMKYNYWTLTSSPDNILQICQKLKKTPIYLSPDSPDQLTEINPNAAYIIGGLVDRTVIKNASYYRAQQLGIQSVRLPIRQFMKGRKCLNLDHVVSIICKFKEIGDWKTAFDLSVPIRWRKDVQKLSKGKRIRRAKLRREQDQKEGDKEGQGEGKEKEKEKEEGERNGEGNIEGNKEIEQNLESQSQSQSASESQSEPNQQEEIQTKQQLQQQQTTIQEPEKQKESKKSEKIQEPQQKNNLSKQNPIETPKQE